MLAVDSLLHLLPGESSGLLLLTRSRLHEPEETKKKRTVVRSALKVHL